VIEEQALAHDLVYVNGGQRGLQVRLQVRDLVSALRAIVAPIVA
jgi:Cys-tRNA(Pro)/Cys-tRNA(Cys) deacylase